MISTEHVIDFDNLVLTDKEVFGEWKYLISENDGFYSEKDQYLHFEFKGIKFIIGFDLSISGYSWYKPSTYTEEADGETKITDVDIDVNYLSVDDEEIVTDKDLSETLTEVVKKYVKCE